MNPEDTLFPEEVIFEDPDGERLTLAQLRAEYLDLFDQWLEAHEWRVVDTDEEKG